MCNYCLVKTKKQCFGVDNGNEEDELNFIDLGFSGDQLVGNRFVLAHFKKYASR